MDIYSFINSWDIREHLRKIEYQFSPLEAAWLIWQCRSATVAQKHTAWEELIRTTPDCAIPERLNLKPQASLHAFLKSYMDIEDRLARDFENRPGALYSYRIFDEEKREWSWESSLFSSLEAARRDMWEDWGLPERYKMEMVIPNEANYFRTEIFNAEDELCWIGDEAGIFGDITEEEADLTSSFYGMWFNFPTPFRKGDIIWDPEKAEDDFCCGPMVMLGIGLDGVENERTRKNLEKDGDNTDMTVWGYFQSEDGSFYHEVAHNYMDFEYYRKPISGRRRILTALSSFVQDKIDIALFARSYHYLMLSHEASVAHPFEFTPDGMRLAGLVQGEEEEKEES